MAKLELSVKEGILLHIHDDDTVLLQIDATANGKDMKNADITASSLSGTLSPESGKSGANGIFQTKFTPEAGTFGKIEITFNGSKGVLDPADPLVVEVIVDPKPIEFYSRTLEYELGIYEIRELILNTIKAELDNDPDFNVDTGASRSPIYRNGFSFETRDFPQIIVAGGTKTARRAGIGDHIIGPHAIDDDGSVHKLKGGFYDIALTLAAVAEDKPTQEQLLDRATSALWSKRLINLLHGDILVKAINAGPETTEKWGAKLLYAGGVSLQIATQWMLKDKHLLTVTDISEDPDYPIEP